MHVVAIKIKNKAGAAAASRRSSDADMYAVVAKVSKLNGLKINVIGSSFKRSIKVTISAVTIANLFMGIWIFFKRLNGPKPKFFAVSS